MLVTSTARNYRVIKPMKSCSAWGGRETNLHLLNLVHPENKPAALPSSYSILSRIHSQYSDPKIVHGGGPAEAGGSYHLTTKSSTTMPARGIRHRAPAVRRQRDRALLGAAS
eukprot:SAG31_NODE_251_length_19069_cov_5.843226_8_plen_112_part_00